jgi:large subunit ribosomal protein L7/L12
MSFDVVLRTVGDRSIEVIKLVRLENPALGLNEARELVVSAPVMVATGLSHEDAERLVAALMDAGATAEVR